MALTQTDKDTIARIARKEVKDFMAKPQFKKEIEQQKNSHRVYHQIVNLYSKNY